MSQGYPNIGTIKRTVFYLKSHCRRPVSTGLPLGLTDFQDLIPPAWCPRCGKELFESDCPCGSDLEGAMCDV